MVCKHACIFSNLVIICSCINRQNLGDSGGFVLWAPLGLSLGPNWRLSFNFGLGVRQCTLQWSSLAGWRSITQANVPYLKFT
jgi:hypothetical protein